MPRLVLISDTHNQHRKIDLPEGDILVHAGDLSAGRGNWEQLRDFNNWMGEVDFEHKVVICGNHDFIFQNSPDTARALTSNFTYLENDSATVLGLKFWGSPYTPVFHNWAFNLHTSDELRRCWAKIPDDTDVVITHGPPCRILDETYLEGMHVGCLELRKRIFKIKPKLHVFGHIHEGYGAHEEEGIAFVNASTCNFRYNPVHEPITIDL